MAPVRIDIQGRITSLPWESSDVSAKQVVDKLQAAGSADVEVHIHSPGGEVWEGLNIGNALRAYPGKTVCIIGGVCASAATMAAVSCGEVHMPAASFFMIHESASIAMGFAEDLEKQAALLRQINEVIVDLYQRKTGASREQIAQWMNAETWFPGSDALAAKFCDKLLDAPPKVENRSFGQILNCYRNVPAQLRTSPVPTVIAQTAPVLARPDVPSLVVATPAPKNSNPPQRNPIAMDRKQVVAGLASALAMAFEYAQAGAEGSDQELQTVCREILAAEKLPACSGLIMPLAQADGADVTSETARSMVGVYALAQELTGQKEGVAGALEALGKNAKSKTSVATASLDVKVEQQIQIGIKATKLTTEDGRSWRVAIASGKKTLADLTAFVKVALPAAENASGEEIHGATQGGEDGDSKRPVSSIVANLTDWEL